MQREYYDDHGGRSSQRGQYYDDDRGRQGMRRGGERSSESQGRDEYGRFTGYRDHNESDRNGSSRWHGDMRSYDDDRQRYEGSRYEGSRGRQDDYMDSAGRHYSRDSWERAQEGRSQGGQHSGGQFRAGGGRMDEDDYSDDRSYGSRRSSSRYSDEDERGGGITDSAGRHYSRESWERAQEGRSRGGRH